MTETRLRYDVAYGCFFFCGVVALLISTISVIPMDTGTSGGLGFMVLIPLSIASLVAMVIGISYTIRFRQHRPLVVLSLFSVLFVAEVVTEYGSVKFYNAVSTLYGLTTCGFSLAWFFVLRKQKCKDV
jgi:hypothetical protein